MSIRISADDFEDYKAAGLVLLAEGYDVDPSGCYRVERGGRHTIDLLSPSERAVKALGLSSEPAPPPGK